MRFLIFIPLLSCLLYLAFAGDGRRPAPKMEDLEITSERDPDAARIQAEVKRPPDRVSGRLPTSPTCVDNNGAAFGTADAGFEACRTRMLPRDTASGARSPGTTIEPGGIPSATRPGVAVPVGR